ncbi:MAG: alpha/beta hydrolase [Acidimicrobiales bacterium]|nr:alpha/beta hydrolase [Acidimicrobiales bacterium]
MDEAEVIASHREAGRMFQAGGVESFVRESGDGPNVLCLHGVPSSSFLYRKVLTELADRGLRGIAFDLPGLGFAARPKEFDYSWTGLGRFASAAVDSLGLQRFHLVVHDIGGPVGFELAAQMPERIQSLTVLNTLVEVSTFKKPWPMRPFQYPMIGSAWLKGMSRPALRILMRLQGIGDMSAVSKAELGAYLALLKRGDGGKAFLRIMQGFETTEAKQTLYLSTLNEVPYPVQVIWGEHDPALSIETFGEAARRAAGVQTIHRLPGKHFLQEDQAAPLAALISAFVRSGRQ